MSILEQLLGKLRSSKKEVPIPEIDLAAQLKRIKQKEAAGNIEPGRKIHSFSYEFFEIRLDRDITKNYRITVYRGNERVYSFTVFVNQAEDKKLEAAYLNILAFLKSDRNPASLPDTNLLKGFYFGHH